MNLQAQQKASNKRTGKRISFFNEQGLPAQSKQQLKEEYLYGRRGNLSTSQASELPKTEGIASSVPNHALSNSVIFTHDQGEPMRMSQQMAADKWQNSVMMNRPPERSDASWLQHHPSQMWNHNVMYSSSQKGVHPASLPDLYSQHEALKRSQEKGVGVSQLDMYGDAVQQMLSQKAQLEQQALAMQQAHYNSILQAQKQQQHQQQQQQQQQHQQHHQQQQNQALPLQPFQLAFGHQGQKQGLPLPDLFHVFQDAPAASNTTYTAQQKQALPQMQLFENFYPTQQQQQQAVAQAYSRQQAASMAQSHGVPQHQMHLMGQYQQAPTERNQGLLKALPEQNQPILPKSQISFPRRSRRLSKEGVAPQSTAGGAPISNPGEEQGSSQFIHQWQQHPGVQMQAQLEVPGNKKENYQQSLEPQPSVNQVQMSPQQQCQPETESLPTSQNGKVKEMQEAVEHSVVKAIHAGGGGITGGVIQSTRRRRRISQEANLLTLAQKAVELASLQTETDEKTTQETRTIVEYKSNMDCDNAPASKKAREDGTQMPLIIPVSVPVKKVDPMDTEQEKGQEEGRAHGVTVHNQHTSEQKPSVIVTRQRFSRTNNTEPSVQENNAPKEEAENLSRKPKQRPRPEPLFIPPKPGTFVVPSVYSSITPYQSHLRSPVRLADHPSDRNFVLPPYTPPPILSPVREGSGLYFNAILTASGHCGPPPFTPKSAPRTLLRAVSSDMTPPVLTVMGEATPVSIEPRINVGSRFQAEIPEFRDRRLTAMDQPMADLVWQPWGDMESNQATQEKVEALLTASCSGILPGAGTNQELALHCLHEAQGNILAALTRLLLKRPRRPWNHPLAEYHYTGSDRWTTTEKKLFNKGIAIYKKDFLLVQKLIKTKTVAQCVEFYYTFKKQVKIGRNGTLIFGDIEHGASERTTQEEAEVDNKSSQRLATVVLPRREAHKEEPVPSSREADKEEPVPSRREAHKEEPVPSRRGAHKEEPVPSSREAHKEEPVASRREAHKEEPVPSRREFHKEEPVAARREVHKEEPVLPRREAHKEEPAPPKREVHKDEPLPTRGVAHREEPAPPRREVHKEELVPPWRVAHKEEPAPPTREAQKEEPAPPRREVHKEEPLPSRRVAHREEYVVSIPKVVIEKAQEKIEEVFQDHRKADTPPKVTQTLQSIETAKNILIHRTPDPICRNVEKPKEIPAVKKRKTHPPAERKKPDPFTIPLAQECSFPCKKCGRVFSKVKSRSAHMKSHSEQEKKAAALKEKQKEEAAAVEAAAAAAAAVAAAVEAARSQALQYANSDSGSSSRSSSSSSSSNSSSCGSSDEGEV